MAEALFRHKVSGAGLSEQIHVDSAGTGNYHVGDPPHRKTLAILDTAKIGYDGIIGRQITLGDLANFDYILTMDEANLRDVRALGTARARVHSLMQYAPDANTSVVPDKSSLRRPACHDLPGTQFNTSVP